MAFNFYSDMTNISPVNTDSAFSVWPIANTGANAAFTASADSVVSASPSTIVTLGERLDAEQATYAAPVAVPAKTVWQHDAQDNISALMADNFHYETLSGRFKDLGASLLQRFGKDGSHFSQKISLVKPADQDLSKISTASSALTIKTASGAEVSMMLANQDNSLSVEIYSNGELSDQERAAVAELAQGYQLALDGLSSVPPKLDLTGLQHYDNLQLRSVDLRMDVKPAGGTLTQTLFHADNDSRSLSVDGPAGKLQLKVDISNPALWGNQAQQAVTMANLQKQFDAAGVRGQADEGQIKLLKDAFTQLNHSDKSQSGLDVLQSLNQQDHALLTGLADYSLSLVATTTQPNRRRPDEVKTFSYQASQSTEIDDKDVAERTVVQNQGAKLNASFHSAAPGKPLDFDRGTYIYNQVEDATHSQTVFSYHNAQLASAGVQQSASEVTKQIEYENGFFLGKYATPKQASHAVDLLPLLLSDVHADRLKTEEQRTAERASRLRQVHALIQSPVSVNSLSSDEPVADYI